MSRGDINGDTIMAWASGFLSPAVQKELEAMAEHDQGLSAAYSGALAMVRAHGPIEAMRRLELEHMDLLEFVRQQD